MACVFCSPRIPQFYPFPVFARSPTTCQLMERCHGITTTPSPPVLLTQQVPQLSTQQVPQLLKQQVPQLSTQQVPTNLESELLCQGYSPVHLSASRRETEEEIGALEERAVAVINALFDGIECVNILAVPPAQGTDLSAHRCICNNEINRLLPTLSLPYCSYIYQC